MRKSVLTLLIILSLATVVYAEGTVPVMRPSAPDVPSEVKTEEGDYMPGVYKQHEDVKVDEVDASNPKMPTEEEVNQSNTADDEEYEYVEEDENGSETEDGTLNDALEGENNPINTDASNENVKNGNFVPVQNVTDKVDKKVQETTNKTKNAVDNAVNTVNTSGDKVDNTVDKTLEKTNKKVKKVKNKKSKKEKPKYGKYKDADNDPYIQSWEGELKELDPKTGMPLNKTTEEEKIEQAKKTYSQGDYEQAYRDMQVPDFSYIHGVDPDQYYDMKSTTWSPYPLLRLNSPLYFKTITINPGYYLLTPRKYKDNWYILFKEAGVVKYTIPVFDKSFTPATYYRDNLPEHDMSRSARWQLKFLHAWGKYVRSSRRKPEIKCNVELTDLDNNFLLIDLYYGAHKYSTIFRIEKF